MNPIQLLTLGLILGLRHAADPDHVVAVSAITARTGRAGPAALLGAVWGLGHTLTLLVLGTGILFFNWAVSPRIGLALEFVVALALVLVGLSNLHGGRARDDSGLGAGTSRPPTGRAFFVGMAHGLAGSAAIALLVLATVRDLQWAMVYLLCFGAGTLIGMVLITTGFAFPLSAMSKRWGGTARLIRVSTGALSVCVGAWLIYQIGWRDGLFLALPFWTPH